MALIFRAKVAKEGEDMYCDSLFPIGDKTIRVDAGGHIIVEFCNDYITKNLTVYDEVLLGGIVFVIRQIIGMTNEVNLVSKYPILTCMDPAPRNIELTKLLKKISLNCQYTVKDIRLPTFEEYKSAVSNCNFDSGDYLYEGLRHIFRYNKESKNIEKLYGSYVEGYVTPILEIEECLPQWSKVSAFGYCWIAIEDNKLLCATGVASSYYSDNEPSDYVHRMLLNWLNSAEKMHYSISKA